jgi:hypothetical protein
VDEDNRFTVYGIRDLGTELSPITMLANSEFVVLLKQANTDSSKMAEVIGVSEKLDAGYSEYVMGRRHQQTSRFSNQAVTFKRNGKNT